MSDFHMVCCIDETHNQDKRRLVRLKVHFTDYSPTFLYQTPRRSWGGDTQTWKLREAVLEKESFPTAFWANQKQGRPRLQPGCQDCNAFICGLGEDEVRGN